MSRQRNPTMADVARHAGVSPSTATRVVYQNGYVSEENRRRVEEAVKVTGYRPNAAARALRTQRTFTLGLVMSQATANPFYSHVSHALHVEAARRGYTLLSLNHDGARASETEALQRLRERSVEAVIFCHARDAANVQAALDAAVPVVQIERQKLLGCRVALVDQAPGISDAVAHLAGLGHRRVAFLAGDPNRRDEALAPEKSVEAQRIAAFLAATARAGMAREDTPVVTTDYDSQIAEIPLAAYMLGRELLARDPRPTAIMAGSDIFAAGVLQAAYEAGLRVPDDVSVIGYDNSFAAFLTPPLTSVAQPLADLGRAAIDLAVEGIERPDTTPRSEIFPTRLVVRQSTGPAPTWQRPQTRPV